MPKYVINKFEEDLYARCDPLTMYRCPQCDYRGVLNNQWLNERQYANGTAAICYLCGSLANICGTRNLVWDDVADADQTLKRLDLFSTQSKSQAGSRELLRSAQLNPEVIVDGAAIYLSLCEHRDCVLYSTVSGRKLYRCDKCCQSHNLSAIGVIIRSDFTDGVTFESGRILDRPREVIT